MATAAVPVDMDYQDFPDEEEGASSATEDMARRELQRLRKEALEKASEEFRRRVGKKVAQKIASRALFRSIALAAGATLVGIIVTYLIWTVQLFAGNLLGSKIIPPLDFWEIILWGILSFIVLFALILAIVQILPAVLFAGGIIDGLQLFGSLIWEVAQSWF